MSLNIVQAPRASTPYPWMQFYKWALEQGLTVEEFETLWANGVEPGVTHAIGLTLDDSLPYPGLPSLEGSTLDPDPGVRMIGGTTP